MQAEETQWAPFDEKPFWKRPEFVPRQRKPPKYLGLEVGWDLFDAGLVEMKNLQLWQVLQGRWKTPERI